MTHKVQNSINNNEKETQKTYRPNKEKVEANNIIYQEATFKNSIRNRYKMRNMILNK